MHILSVGDSWSAGAWNIVDDKHVVDDIGYQHELNKIGKVTNYWTFNNNQALQNLYNHHHHYDVVLFFVTDPFRDITHYKKPYSFFVNDILTAGELLTAHNVLLESTMQALNSFGSKVKVIGGCQTLTHRDDKNIVVHSASELASNKEYTHPLIWDSGWSGIINYEKCKRDLLVELDKNRQLQDAMESEEFQKYFYPDGYHLNKKSNKILGEHLVKILTS